jgi:hypothetical protein
MGLFSRIVTVAVGQAGLPGLLVSGLRVNFRVKMSQSSSANEATIRMWNPNPATIALLEEGPQPTVVLSVGYGQALDPLAKIPRQIFTGGVIKDGLTVRKEGPDRIVEIEAKDGGLAIASTNVNLTFKTPTAMSVVVAAIAAEMTLPIGSIALAPDVVLSNGGSFSGQGSVVLDRIAASVGGAWWITDGVFFFVAPASAPVPQGEAPLFSSLTGNLIGAVKRKDRGGVEVRALLDASLRPGSPFAVQSVDALTGVPTEPQVYTATDVVFEGDSGFDVPYYVTTTGRLPGT